MNECWIKVDGIRTRYLEAGSGGATILLLHAGALGGEGVFHNAFAYHYLGSSNDVAECHG